MDDAELTKKVIAEILKDINDYKEKGSLPMERKKNPLGKPNKRFLGRTINSVMKHNERQSGNNHRRCKRKLRELDAKQRKREYKKIKRTYEKGSESRNKSESSDEVFSGASEDEDHKDKKRRNIKKRKSKKKNKKSSSSSSSSSNSSSETESDCSTLPTTTKKHKKHERNKTKPSFKNEENEDEFNTDVTYDHSMGYYMDPHVAYAAMAYGHINQVLQHQMVQEQQTIKDELDENVEIPSDLSLSYHSESSLNISLNSSSAEEDENGILTFKLISSDDEKKSNLQKISRKRKEIDLQKISTKRKEIEDNIVMIIDSDDNDKSSVKSYVSLESKASLSPNRKSNEIFLLSSSSSESEDLEILETISETKKEHLEQELIETNEQKTDGVLQINENVSKTDEVLIPNENALANESQVLEKKETGNGLIVNEEDKTVETLASNSENEIPTIKENTNEFENNLNINKDNDGEIIDDNSALNTNKVETPERISNSTMIDLTEE
ncbi:hypothetical protein DOY81_007348 [Sarcophaga bullata]|nr:hypothetical protein DOY81_007348 [Sarcophaga bullata]